MVQEYKRPMTLREIISTLDVFCARCGATAEEVHGAHYR